MATKKAAKAVVVSTAQDVSANVETVVTEALETVSKVTVVQPTHIEGHVITAITRLPNDRYEIHTADGVGFTLPQSEYDLLK